MIDFKKHFINHINTVIFIVAILITIQLGIMAGIFFVYQDVLQIRDPEDIKPAVMTTLYDDLNQPVKEFYMEKRKIVSSKEIPEYLKIGFIFAEDKEFKSHWGINIKGTLRAIFGKLILNRNLGGGSSITQQLARQLFLTKNVSMTRKFQEMLLAIQLERKYSKDQILTFYLNEVFLGYNNWGFEAASKFYFGKSVSKLSIAQALLLCVIPPSPGRVYDIFKNPKNRFLYPSGTDGIKFVVIVNLLLGNQHCPHGYSNIPRFPNYKKYINRRHNIPGLNPGSCRFLGFCRSIIKKGSNYK